MRVYLGQLTLVMLIAIMTSCHRKRAKHTAENTAKVTISTVYTLEIPEKYKTEKYADDLKGWLSSLYKGLGYDKNKTGIEIFLRSDISVKSSSEKYAVYQSMNNKERFYIKELSYVVDFKEQEIGGLGVAGISTHIPPSERMVVLLCPTKGEHFMGVLLGAPKTEHPKPQFLDRKVTFTLNTYE